MLSLMRHKGERIFVGTGKKKVTIKIAGVHRRHVDLVINGEPQKKKKLDEVFFVNANGHDVEVNVCKINTCKIPHLSQAHLGFDAPDNISVDREEIRKQKNRRCNEKERVSKALG